MGIVDRSAPACVAFAQERRLVEEWALVLVTQGLAPTVVAVPQGHALYVPAAQAERAAVALATYTRESAPAPPAPPPALWAGPAPLQAALLVGAALLAFFLVTGPRKAGAAWFEHGAAVSDLVLDGQPWRTVTALVLHADAAHVLANALAGTLFLAAVFRALGPGLGGAAVLLAGAAGNLANAMAHGSGHASVGASTAVFGAVGLLGGLAAARRRERGPRRRAAWVPLAASLALLAMLGTGGPRTDLWAHGFGLGAGAALGGLLGRAVRRPPPLVAQWSLGALALAVLFGSWLLAWSASA